MPDGISSSGASGSAYEGMAACRQRRLMCEEMVPALVGLADVFAITAASFAAHGIRFRWEQTGEGAYMAATLLMTTLVVIAFRDNGLYRPRTIAAWPQGSRRIVVCLVAIALLLTGLAFAFKISDQFSRIWLTGMVTTSVVLILALRSVTAALIRRAANAGIFTRTVAVVGAGRQAEHFLDRLANAKAPWTRVIGIFDDRSTRIGSNVGGVPLRGNIDDLITSIRRRKIDDVVITLPWNAEGRLIYIIDRLRMLPVHIYLGDDLIGCHVGSRHRAFAAGISIVEVARAPLSGWNGLVKALEDRLLVVLALFCFLPLMALIAVAIKLDSRGPALFRQMRHGFNNERIEVFKFRTMYHTMRDESGEMLTKVGDPRVTRVGRFLRRTSLDELPQLFNVWNRTMSMVGPRPHPIRAKAGQRLYEEVVFQYAARHRVKPGITGWAQVNGWRGNTDSEEKIKKRVECDLYYIENWSLWLDVRILFATAFRGWVHKNAY